MTTYTTSEINNLLATRIQILGTPYKDDNGNKKGGIPDKKALKRIEPKATQKLKDGIPLNWLEQIALLCRYSEKCKESWNSIKKGDIKDGNNYHDLRNSNLFHDFTHWLTQLTFSHRDEALLSFHNDGFAKTQSIEDFKADLEDLAYTNSGMVMVTRSSFEINLNIDEALFRLNQGFLDTKRFPLISELYHLLLRPKAHS